MQTSIAWNRFPSCFSACFLSFSYRTISLFSFLDSSVLNDAEACIIAMRITKTQFSGLDRYKYSGVDKSIVSRHILGPFWNWLVTLFPKTLAPNTVGPPSHFPYNLTPSP